MSRMLQVLAAIVTVLFSLRVVLCLPAVYDGLEEEELDTHDLAKRGYRPVPFPCNGYDNVPRCLHGGKGPRKTWTKSGRFCVCLCPSRWIGAECGYAAELGR